MADNTHTIPLETAEALWELKDYGDPYGGYTPIHDEQTSTSQWVTYHQVIIRRDSDGTLWALPYQSPVGDGDCNAFHGDPVTVHRVRAEQVTVTKYVNA